MFGNEFVDWLNKKLVFPVIRSDSLHMHMYDIDLIAFFQFVFGIDAFSVQQIILAFLPVT